MKSKLTEEEILQLSNDLSEGDETGTVEDWRAVADYWRDCYELLSRSRAEQQTSADFAKLEKMLEHFSVK